MVITYDLVITSAKVRKKFENTILLVKKMKILFKKDIRMVYGCNRICALAQKKNVVMTVYLIITTFLFFA